VKLAIERLLEFRISSSASSRIRPSSKRSATRSAHPQQDDHGIADGRGYADLAGAERLVI
jgi:hypothetical protein